jgi:putative cell wall-binding protein
MLVRMRTAVALALAVLVSTALVGLPAAAQGALVPAPARTVVAEARDWATTTFGDPWDFADAADAHTWAPAVHGGTASIADGRLRFTVPGPGGGHVPLIFPSFEGTVLAERDGDRVPLDAGTYRTAVLRVHASAPVTAAVVTRTCTGVTVQCDAYADVQLARGWHTYTVALADSDPVHGLRLALAGGPVEVQVDWVRVIAGEVDRVAVTGVGQLYWDVDADTGNNTADSPGWGRVDGGAFPAGAHPPGAYRFYAALGDGSAADATRSGLSAPLHVLARPATTVIDPDAAGGEDYITAATGDAWDFSQAGDATVHHATAVQVADGRLSATNTSNDPHLTLRMGPPIDPARYHRLTVTFANDGPFDLSHDPGGGSMGRVLWSTEDPALLRWTDGNDIVAYPNQPTHTFDLAAPTALEEGVTRPGWGAAPVTAVRFDPNEDPGPRRWHVDEIRLAADDETGGGGFDVTFDDPSTAVPAPPGTTTRYEVYADTDRSGHDGVLVATGSVTGPRTVARWHTAGTAPGRYEIHVRVIREAAGVQSTSDTYATGPVVVRPADTGAAAPTTGGTGSGQPDAQPDAPADPHAELRIAGPSRVDTAAALARESFPDGSRTAVVVTGQAFADALAAAPLAAALDAPVLLTARDVLPDPTAAALADLGVQRVVVLGGVAAVSDAVAGQLAQGGRTVERLAGPDRFATAVAAARMMIDLGAVADEVVLASGATFPDALAGGWRAAVLGTPLLLLGPAGPSPAVDALLTDLAVLHGVRTAVGVGGPAVLANAALAAVRRPGMDVTRLSGDSRWATAARVVATTDAGGAAGVLVASGEDFPDALAAGPAAAATGRLLVLTARDDLPEATADLLDDVGDVDVRVVGGPAAVAASTLARLVDLLGLLGGN